MANDIQRDTDDLWRYYSELGRRIGQTGVRDASELLALYEQLRRSLSVITRQELEWASEQAGRLIEHLVHLDSSLQSLKALKQQFDRIP